MKQPTSGNNPRLVRQWPHAFTATALNTPPFPTAQNAVKNQEDHRRNCDSVTPHTGRVSARSRSTIVSSPTLGSERAHRGGSRRTTYVHHTMGQRPTCRLHASCHHRQRRIMILVNLGRRVGCVDEVRICTQVVAQKLWLYAIIVGTEGLPNPVQEAVIARRRLGGDP